MSVCYSFVCDKCRERGEFIVSKAWGWGNFDIIESFKFISYHIDNCGEDNIRIISEYSEEDDEYKDVSNAGDLERRKKFLKETKKYFPYSDDWKIMMEFSFKDDGADFKKLWVEKALVDLESGE